MMDRRTFIGAITGSVVVASLAAKAQQAGRIYRIGLEGTSSLTTEGTSSLTTAPWWAAFLQRLRERGWIENQNFVTERLFTEQMGKTSVALAKELEARHVDVIVVTSTEWALAAKQASNTIPMVMATIADPVGNGLVANLAHPGGNFTGISFQGTELAAKQLNLLKQAFPSLSRVVVLANPANASHALRVKEAEVAARTLHLQLDVVEARQASEIESAFAAIARKRAEAILVLADGVFRREATRLATLARVPAMYGQREHVVAGGLMSYGASFTELFRQAADYVDKILRGAKPADLPVEQPTTFELVINLKTARALGIAIPQSLLLRADEVIQ
jgi:putative tryptophan/tyrosine transport system substrate-binding protein